MVSDKKSHIRPRQRFQRRSKSKKKKRKVTRVAPPLPVSSKLPVATPPLATGSTSRPRKKSAKTIRDARKNSALKGWKTRRQNIAAAEALRRKKEISQTERSRIGGKFAETHEHIRIGHNTIRRGYRKKLDDGGFFIRRELAFFLKRPMLPDEALEIFQPWCDQQIAAFDAFVFRRLGFFPETYVEYNTWTAFDKNFRVGFGQAEFASKDFSFREVLGDIKKFAKDYIKKWEEERKARQQKTGKRQRKPKKETADPKIAGFRLFLRTQKIAAQASNRFVAAKVIDPMAKARADFWKQKDSHDKKK